jgi:hypothetical protein
MHKGKRHSKRRGHKKGSRKQIMVEQVGCAGVMMGGNASDHVIAVVGNMNNQHAQAGSNVIAQNHAGPEVLGGAPVIVQNGGGLAALSPAEVQSAPAQVVAVKQAGGKRRGKTLVSGLAVPTVLLYANKLIGKSNKARKSRGSRRTRKH